MTEAIQKCAVMVKSPSGVPLQAPDVATADRQSKIRMRMASEFGFILEGRSSMSTPPQPELTLFDGLQNPSFNNEN